MGTAQGRMAGMLAHLWLAVLLLQAAAKGAAAAPAIPLALSLQGRTYDLSGEHPRLDLPLGCPGGQAQLLSVQHRVHLPPSAAARLCSAALSVLAPGPEGRLDTLLTQDQVRVGPWQSRVIASEQSMDSDSPPLARPSRDTAVVSVYLAY